MSNLEIKETANYDPLKPTYREISLQTNLLIEEGSTLERADTGGLLGDICFEFGDKQFATIKLTFPSAGKELTEFMTPIDGFAGITKGGTLVKVRTSVQFVKNTLSLPGSALRQFLVLSFEEEFTRGGSRCVEESEVWCHFVSPNFVGKYLHVSRPHDIIPKDKPNEHWHLSRIAGSGALADFVPISFGPESGYQELTNLFYQKQS